MDSLNERNIINKQKRRNCLIFLKAFLLLCVRLHFNFLSLFFFFIVFCFAFLFYHFLFVYLFLFLFRFSLFPFFFFFFFFILISSIYFLKPTTFFFTLIIIMSIFTFQFEFIIISSRNRRVKNIQFNLFLFNTHISSKFHYRYNNVLILKKDVPKYMMLPPYG